MNLNTSRAENEIITTSANKYDRLSSLPDSILCHILSFIPTKYAARTSILSTRWNNLFLGVPKVVIEDPELSRSEGFYRCNYILNFVNFVSRRLKLCTKSSITEFRLKCTNLPEAPVMNLWLTTLLFHDLEVLEIQESKYKNVGPSPQCPPSGIFQWKTLVILKLSGKGIVLNIPEFVRFSSLKVLNLSYLEIHFESGNFRIAEGYPQLEHMRLDNISFHKNKDNKCGILRISLLNLKTLAVILLGNQLSRIDIDAPHLQHLEYTNIRLPKTEVNLSDCETLVSAYLSETLGPGVSTQKWYDELLSRIKSVKKLHLLQQFSESISEYVDSVPEFPNLTHLKLNANGESMWILLQRAPSLEELDYSMVGLQGDRLSSLIPEKKPPCLVRNLKEVRLRNFQGSEAECAVLGYFMQHRAVLERIFTECSSYGVQELFGRP